MSVNIHSGDHDPAAKHSPLLHYTGRHGCWCVCSCGWRSELFWTTTGAHYAFGCHLASQASEPLLEGQT